MDPDALQILLADRNPVTTNHPWYCAAISTKIHRVKRRRPSPRKHATMSSVQLLSGSTLKDGRDPVAGEPLEVEFHRQLTDAAPIVAEDNPKVAGAVVEVPIHSTKAIELRMVEGVKEFRAEFCRSG
jgi:hypothetical protein